MAKPWEGEGSDAGHGDRGTRLRRPLVGGGDAVAALPIDHVVAGDGYGVDGLGELHLEDQVALVAERHLGGREVELPHPTEPLIVKRSNALAVGVEALPP